MTATVRMNFGEGITGSFWFGEPSGPYFGSGRIGTFRFDAASFAPVGRGDKRQDATRGDRADRPA